jgi:hypothetical protein
MQMDRKMDMNIEPRLKIFLDAQIAIARATFAKDEDEQQSLVSLLHYCAGFGLVTVDVDSHGKLMWIGTEELYANPPALFDVNALEKETQDSKPPRVVPSLQIVLDEYLKHDSTDSKGRVVTQDVVLLAWSILSLVRLLPEGPGWCGAGLYGADGWTAFPEYPVFQQWLRKQFHKPRLCPILKQEAKFTRKLMAAQVGRELPRAICDGSHLATCELSGSAVATSMIAIAWPGKRRPSLPKECQIMKIIDVV